MKKVLFFIMMLAVMCMLININNSYADEIKYIEYKVTADNTGLTDATINIQHYLNIAKYNATDEIRYKIIVPKGIYKLTKNLNIFSNTWLYLEDGATMLRCFSEGCMLKNGVTGTEYYGYDAFKNIKIEGGTWNGNCFDENYGYDKSKSFCTIRFAHASNIEFDNVKVINNKGGHHLEFGGVEGLAIRNCSFSGYLEEYKADGSYIGKEVIQLDVLHSSDIFRGYESFDDTTVNNVIIENNEFIDVARGIGSHSAVIGRYYNNIVIRNNTFKNLTQQGIIAYNFKNCEIYNNVMENVGIGIDFKYMTKNSASFYMPNNKDENIEVNNNANTVIKNNIIKTKMTDYVQSSTGILIYGYNMVKENVNTNNVNIYDYKVENVKIDNNVIQTEGFAIYLNNADKCNIINNTLSFINSKNRYSVINLNNESCNNIIQKNKVIKSVNGGIYVTGNSKSNTITSNIVSNTLGNGIRVYDNSRSNNIISNKIYNTYNGISIDNSASANIKNNSIYKNNNFGITAKDKAYVIIQNNEIYSNKSHGIDLRNTDKSNKISKNTIYLNGMNGVYATNIIKTEIVSNIVKNNLYYGIGIGPISNGVKIKNNTFTGNQKRAINFSEVVSKRLESINVIYNKGYKIKVSGNKKAKIYLKYNNRNILYKTTSSSGMATYNFVKAYKNRIVKFYGKDSNGNVTYLDVKVKY